MSTRLKLLVAAHLIVGVAPSAMFLGTESWFLPLIWALGGLSLGQLMLVSFWVGMGTSARWRRLLGATLALIYFATWSTVALSLAPIDEMPSYAENFSMQLLQGGLLLGTFAAIFAAVRRWYMELRLVADPEPVYRRRQQFTIFHLLVITSVAAVVLALARERGVASDGTAQILMATVLMLVLLGVNVVASVWAALSPGILWSRIMLALVAAALLGMAFAMRILFAKPLGGARAWLFVAQSLTFMVPSLVVILSLLVVRSCGYRLVRRTRGTSERPALAEPVVDTAPGH
jgi:hypothetical protein